MKTANQIRLGQEVLVTFPWREDELSANENFYTGKVEDVISKSTFICYVRVEGLENLVPVDRVRVLSKEEVKAATN